MTTTLATLLAVMTASLAAAIPPAMDRAPEDDAALDARRIEIRDRLERRAASVESLAARIRTAAAAIDGGASIREALGELPSRDDLAALDLSDPARLAGEWPGAFETGARETDARRADAGRGERASGADLAEIRAFIEAEMPALGTLLERVGERGPAAGQRMLRRIAPRIAPIIDLHARDPEMGDAKLAEMRAQFGVGSAARAARLARSPEDPGLGVEELADLEAALGAYFDARVEVARIEIRRLGDRLGQLESELARHLAEREAMIAEKVGEITSGEGGRTWFGASPNDGPVGGARKRDRGDRARPGPTLD